MRILFLCVANSARSQMAEGLAKKILGPSFEIHSAGSHPSRVHPASIEVLHEIGIDISQNTSKSINDLPPEFLSRIDLVITLCAKEICPTVLARARRLHWPLPDPALTSYSPKTQRERFREIRNALRSRIKELARNLFNNSKP